MENSSTRVAQSKERKQAIHAHHTKQHETTGSFVLLSVMRVGRLTAFLTPT
jgi:hypothetical protein